MITTGSGPAPLFPLRVRSAFMGRGAGEKPLDNVQRRMSESEVTPMTMQAFTSAATSINAARIPAVFGKLPERPPVLLDYGCGRYTDHIRAALPGTEYLPFDLFNQPADVNRASLRAAADHRLRGGPVRTRKANRAGPVAAQCAAARLSPLFPWCRCPSRYDHS